MQKKKLSFQYIYKHMNIYIFVGALSLHTSPLGLFSMGPLSFGSALLASNFGKSILANRLKVNLKCDLKKQQQHGVIPNVSTSVMYLVSSCRSMSLGMVSGLLSM